MPFDKTTKEGWAHTLASGLGLTLQGLGFAKSGSAKYTKQEGGYRVPVFNFASISSVFRCPVIIIC